MRRREFTKSLAAGIAALLSPVPRARLARAGVDAGGTGARLVFGYPNGFTNAGSAIFWHNAAGPDGSTIEMMGHQGHLSAGFAYTTKLPPTPFTTTFTFQITNLGTGVQQSGMTFCISNTVSPPGQPGAVGDGYAGDANMCGYGGDVSQYPPRDSIAIKFDASSIDGAHYLPGALPSSTGLYINGGPSIHGKKTLGLIPFNDLAPYAINFYSGHTYDVTIVYDGSLLTMVLLDTTTQAQARFAWPLNLANTTNTTGNYVGFTAGTAAVGTFHVYSWSYWSGYNPRLVTPQFSPPPGQYSGTETVTIRYPAGSTCYYTTNGLLPTSASTKYTGPITVSASEVIQAVAIEAGFTDSLVGTAAYQINTPNVINFPQGFAAGNLVTVGLAYLNGTAVRVSDTTQNTSGAAWFPVPVNVEAFSTDFTLQWGSAGQGMCFVFQNNPPLYTPMTNNASLTDTSGYQINWSGGPTVVGGISGALGYGGLNAVDNNGPGTSYGLLNSVAIAFNQYGGGGDPANSVGLYTNGANPFGSQIATTLAWSSGSNGQGPSNPLKVSLKYDGATLSFTMTDTVTNATFTHSFTIDIPTTVGANTAYVGFTGGTGGASSIQAITAWTYTVTPAPTPVLPNPPTNVRVQ